MILLFFSHFFFLSNFLIITFKILKFQKNVRIQYLFTSYRWNENLLPKNGRVQWRVLWSEHFYWYASSKLVKKNTYLLTSRIKLKLFHYTQNLKGYLPNISLNTLHGVDQVCPIHFFVMNIFKNVRLSILLLEFSAKPYLDIFW